MENIYDNNITNASTINDICSPIIQLGMIRYEALFDYLSEEPSVIKIKKGENDNAVCLEQIFRTRKWRNNTASSSLAIFSSNREWDYYEQSSESYNNGLVIRMLNWDMKADVTKIKSCTKMERNEMLQAWPKVCAKNYWISMSDCKKIIEKLIDFDNTIKSNILLSNREDTFVDWKNFEVRRLFDWGCIQNVWSSQKENFEIDAKVAKIEECIESIIENIDYSIFSMDLDYTIEPTSYKNIITSLI